MAYDVVTTSNIVWIVWISLSVKISKYRVRKSARCKVFFYIWFRFVWKRTAVNNIVLPWPEPNTNTYHVAFYVMLFIGICRNKWYFHNTNALPFFSWRIHWCRVLQPNWIGAIQTNNWNCLNNLFVGWQIVSLKGWFHTRHASVAKRSFCSRDYAK